MPTPTHITVTAAPGRLVPIHSADGVEPGGGQLRVSDAHVARVRWSQGIRRAINSGDLVPCDMNGVSVASAELAAAPRELPGGLSLIPRPETKPGKAAP